MKKENVIIYQAPAIEIIQVGDNIVRTSFETPDNRHDGLIEDNGEW